MRMITVQPPIHKDQCNVDFVSEPKFHCWLLNNLNLKDSKLLHNKHFLSEAKMHDQNTLGLVTKPDTSLGEDIPSTDPVWESTAHENLLTLIHFEAGPCLWTWIYWVSAESPEGMDNLLVTSQRSDWCRSGASSLSTMWRQTINAVFDHMGRGCIHLNTKLNWIHWGKLPKYKSSVGYLLEGLTLNHPLASTGENFFKLFSRQGVTLTARIGEHTAG